MPLFLSIYIKGDKKTSLDEMLHCTYILRTNFEMATYCLFIINSLLLLLICHRARDVHITARVKVTTGLTLTLKWTYASSVGLLRHLDLL